MAVIAILKDEKYEKYAIKKTFGNNGQCILVTHSSCKSKRETSVRVEIHFKNFHSFEYRNFWTTRL